jgi:hypothetical protein
VTGIFERFTTGRLVRISPSCDTLLVGSLEPDPQNRGYQIFVVEHLAR